MRAIRQFLRASFYHGAKIRPSAVLPLAGNLLGSAFPKPCYGGLRRKNFPNSILVFQPQTARCSMERPANESQVGISRFQVRKKATRNQTAERSKIETAVGQRGVQYEIRSAPVCLDKQLPRRSRYAGTCWQKPSCRPCKAFLQNAFCP